MTYFTFWSVYSREFLQTLIMDATKFHQLTYTQHVNQIEHPGSLPLFDLILHLLPLLFKRHDDSGNFYVSTETKAENSLSLLDLLSSPWTHLLHPDHQEVPLILLLTFCLSCITKLLFLDCSLFCAVSWIPLVSDCLLIYTWPVTLWHLPCSHLNNLLPTFSPFFASFLFYEMDAKVFIWAPNLWHVTYFPALPLMCLKHFQVSYKLDFLNYYFLSILTSCTRWFDHSSIL